tara:strand:- start:4926 stop:5801 length:876 start_codon:yes stop_codon:yes gene_type:complete
VSKLIICDGDSWTSGDIIDPELLRDGKDFSHVNHTDNDQYRLPRVWPHKLGKLLDIEIHNRSVAGSSNDAIVRRVVPNVLRLLKKYKSEEIFVIVGWSSPERKDFFFTGEWDGDFLESWETLYPAQIEQNLPNKDIEKFYKLYLRYFWNSQEYMNRFINQNLYLHYFLERNNIKHLFFNAFYECSSNDTNTYEKFVTEAVSGMREKSDLINDIKSLFPKVGNDSLDDGYFKSTNLYVVEEFIDMKNKVMKDVSFRNFLMNRDLFKIPAQHPNEQEHQLWANELYKDLKDKI